MKMHTNRHQEVKLLPPDTFLSCKNVFATGALPRTPLGERAYSAPPDRLAGNGGGAPRKGEKRRGGVGQGRAIPPERKSWLRPCILGHFGDDFMVR